jgi:CRISPR/Cas system CMR-associated protein Cmr1 (group 7 of RAMP superfamily)
MKLLDAIRYRFHMRKASRLAVEIATSSEKKVWSRVRTLIFDMDPHEARGYVRARATAVIRDQIDLALGKHHNLPERVVALVAELACERVVHLVLVDFLSSGKTGRRAAA